MHTSLNHRRLLHLHGKDVASFLQGVLTCDVQQVHPLPPTYGALLTPQGKILADFFILELKDHPSFPDGFYIDLPDMLEMSFLQRLQLYKLRAHVDISPAAVQPLVQVYWGERPPDPPLSDVLAFQDPRHLEGGVRMWFASQDEAQMPIFTDSSTYLAHCINLVMPTGGIDFQYGDAFPHDVNLDLLGGINFEKGCFIGQEVVSRMRHRGTIRKRILGIQTEKKATFPLGTPLTKNGQNIGELGAFIDTKGLARIRLDRLENTQGELYLEDIKVIDIFSFQNK